MQLRKDMRLLDMAAAPGGKTTAPWIKPWKLEVLVASLLLVVMASNLEAMASNLLAMAST